MTLKQDPFALRRDSLAVPQNNIEGINLDLKTGQVSRTLVIENTQIDTHNRLGTNGTSLQPSVTVAVPGTCGELIQGWSNVWDQPVLVSCPITRYSRITVRLRADGHIHLPDDTGSYTKAGRAAALLLARLGQSDLGVDILIDSQLPPGRGMASSTADVVGVLAGLIVALEQPLSPGEMAGLACQIEPSDSTMFAELTLLAYRDEGQYQTIGCAPTLPLLLLDPGYGVDTLVFNQRLNLGQLRTLATTTQAALEMLQEGLTTAKPAAIGAAATLSAQSYQRVVDSPLIWQVMQWAPATGALGVVRAHSGSVVGLLYPPGASLAEPSGWLARRFEGQILETELTSGGYSLYSVE